MQWYFLLCLRLFTHEVEPHEVRLLSGCMLHFAIEDEEMKDKMC
jgi:hypothetical protein